MKFSSVLLECNLKTFSSYFTNVTAFCSSELRVPYDNSICEFLVVHNSKIASSINFPKLFALLVLRVNCLK